ncbi:MAG: glycosyltransferase family protein [Fibrobacterales bacterium]
MDVLAVLQARTSSRRLPGKVLKKILGKPMILHQIERIQRSENIDHLVVATSEDMSDDALEQMCQMVGVDCFRGSLDDVLDRFYQCASVYNPLHVVRLTGDCPLIDPEIIDKLIAYYQGAGLDYASNAIEPTYPDGLDVEVFSYSTLTTMWRQAQLQLEREHVTQYVYNNRACFKIGDIKHSIDYSSMRWTVDEPEDFVFVSKIFQALYKGNEEFGFSDILKLIREQPELLEINNCFKRNDGLEIDKKKQTDDLQ